MAKQRISLYYIAQEYLKSSWFREKSAATQKQYEYYINFYDGRALAVLASKFKASDADAMYQSIKENNGLRTAEYFSSVWKVVFRYAELNGHVDRNPWTVVKIKGSKPRQVMWMRQHVTDIVAHAAAAGDNHLAAFVQLMYETAQRPSDVLHINSWYNDGDQWFIYIQQHKTGAKVTVPISERAWELCGSPEANSRALLLDSKATLDAFRLRFKALRDTLGFPKELQLRDLRRTAITEMSERGATDEEMRTVSGHVDSSMLPTYSVPSIVKAQTMFDRRFKE